MSRNAKPQTSEETKTVKKEIKRVMKGTQVFFHDLYKGSKANGKKNYPGFKQTAESEDIKDYEHVHFFHSHDSNGRPQAKCVAVAGHFHYIETHDEEGEPYTDAKGRTVAKCGPALREIKKRLPNGKSRREEEPVYFMMSDGTRLEDKHTHEFVYVESLELSPDKIEQLKRGNAKQIAGQFEGAPTVKDSTPAPLTQKDGVTIS